MQCEKCHGPGSEHVDAKGEGQRAKLMMPTKNDCLNCHKAKGSHTRVLKDPTVDLEKGWLQISHPTPKDWKLVGLNWPASPADMAVKQIAHPSQPVRHPEPPRYKWEFERTRGSASPV
ncbi:MAG: hypothetical protein NTY19_00310 [Planctomycetota bacterium]|nr:hypothetical protein [Planctomycetota bacterium]